MSDRKFIRVERDKYSLEEKESLEKLCKRYKEEYDAKVEENSKKLNYNDEMKEHTKKHPEKDMSLVLFESSIHT